MIYTYDAWIRQGRCYFKKGDLDMAKVVFQRLAEAEVSDSAKEQAKGWLLRIEEARRKE